MYPQSASPLGSPSTIFVAFSCKGRAFCPSCCGRRMSIYSLYPQSAFAAGVPFVRIAAHLVDRVLPAVPYRQWVLSYPRRLRVLLARDAAATTESARIFQQEVFRLQRRQAKATGTACAQTGSVVFSQRFGSRLNLNIHHHSVVPDGVFVECGEGRVRFEKLDAPRIENLERIVARIAKRTLRMLERRGLLEVEGSDALDRMREESAQTWMGLWEEPKKRRLAAFLEGFSLEAGTHLHANDR